MCIIQDDDGNDWARQSDTMFKVYSLATCTIAAANSGDGSGGIFAVQHNEPVPQQNLRRRRPLVRMVWPRLGFSASSISQGAQCHMEWKVALTLNQPCTASRSPVVGSSARPSTNELPHARKRHGRVMLKLKPLNSIPPSYVLRVVFKKIFSHDRSDRLLEHT